MHYFVGNVVDVSLREKDKRLKYHILQLCIGIVVGVLNIWVKCLRLCVGCKRPLRLFVGACFLLRSKSYMCAVFIMVAIVYTYSAEYLFKKCCNHQRNRIEVCWALKTTRRERTQH